MMDLRKLTSDEKKRLLEELNRYPEFITSATVREKCDRACQLLHLSCKTDKVSFGVLSQRFQVERSNIRRYWSLYQKQGNENLKTGRHTILITDEHEWVVEKIYEAFSQNNPVTACQVCRLIFD
jgi:hypothetical protein